MGSVSIKEIISGIGQMSVKLPRELQDVLKPDKLVDLFEFLDVDGSGELSEVEFVEGVSHMALMHIPVETTQILQLLRPNGGKVGRMEEVVDELSKNPGLRDSTRRVSSTGSLCRQSEAT